MSQSKVLPLHCTVHNYDWGKLGSKSEVALLIKNVCPHFQINEDKPYAELWMGTHPSGPSSIMTPEGRVGRTLLDELKLHPEYLGQKVIDRFGTELPFLFKVLSVRKALSIQAHPNKKRAEQLHKERPDLYKDANHKPEMALALTDFEALCGFRPFDEIVNFVKTIPELSALIGQKLIDDLINANNADVAEQKAALKECFTAVMTSPNSKIEQQLSILIQRTEHEGSDSSNALSKLLLEIHKDFRGDVGCFGIFFLNHLKMKPGNALFLEADEPHAYLSGDCIEIMACSDNVVRAGLTPKYIDTDELCKMLTYNCAPSDKKLFEGINDEEETSNSYRTVYNPPVLDFALDKIEIPSDVTGYTFEAKTAASILLVVRGHAKYNCVGYNGSRDFKRGSTIFIPANETFHIEICPTFGDLLIFQAYCEL